MTQGLRNLLDLPAMEDMLRQAGVFPVLPGAADATAPLVAPVTAPVAAPRAPPEPEPPLDPALARSVALAEQAQARLEMIDGRDHAEGMEKLYRETLKHAQDLMDLGFNVDLPRARGIFEVAANMYGRSIEAKNAKRDGELKAMKLALEQRKLDLTEQRLNAQHGAVVPATYQADASVFKEDRNELIKRLRAQRAAEPPA
jgi:hypothetical protein